MARGQVEHPLNWILIVVTGAFFLLLFFAVIKSVMQNTRGIENARSVTNLDAVFEATQANPGWTNNYTLPGLTTRCGGGGQDYTVEFGSELLTYPYLALFSPSNLEGETVVWSEEFRYPGPLITLTYLLPASTLVLIEDKVNEEIRKEFAERLTTKTFAMGDLQNMDVRGFNPVIVISEDTRDTDLVGKSLRTSRGQHLSGVQITGDYQLGPGTMSFYSYSGEFERTSKEVPYLTKELLFAAAASTSALRYYCGLQKVEDRFHFITTMYRERVKKIDYATNYPECEQRANALVTSLGNVENLQLNNLTESANIVAVKDALVGANQYFRSWNCPLIY